MRQVKKKLKNCRHCKNSGVRFFLPQEYQGYGFIGETNGIAFSRCELCIHGSKKATKARLAKWDKVIKEFAHKLIRGTDAEANT